MDHCCGSSTTLPRNVSRRDLLRWSIAGAGLLALGPMGRFGPAPAFAGPKANTKRLVVLNAFGGNDTTNVVIPKSLSTYFSRRGALAVPNSDSLDLNSGPGATNKYRLHPAMPKLAALYKQGDAALVQRVGYPDENLSHFESQEIFSRGVRDPYSGALPNNGWIARFADGFAPTSLGAVSIGVGRPLDFVGGSTSPFLVNDLTSFRLFADSGNDRSITSSYLHRLEKAKQLVANHAPTTATRDAKLAMQQAHDLADQVQTALGNYTSTVQWQNTSMSRRMKDVAVLIEGGFETQVFYTGRGGFDTHGNQGASTGTHANLLTEFDDAIGDFAQDMKDRGVWNDVVMVLLTEFGRRNFVNGSDGFDHGHAFCEIVIGGKVKGGIYGPDLTDDDMNARYLSYAVDFRSIYKEIVKKHLGADDALVFPEALQIDTSLGFL
jgi:uncharacterized protein (DUF1501 family)